MYQLDELRLGFAVTGSFCTFEKAFAALETLAREYADITPIMSETAFITDTRFGTAAENVRTLERICGKKVISTITGAEPIGSGLFDVLIIAPCTGNTLSKLANGITDTAVTMAAKAHLRNLRPILIAPSTNDGLSGSAVSIGTLLNRKNVFFVPFYQDDFVKKPRSIASRLDLLPDAVSAAAVGRSLQPILTVAKL